jgi:hypothetical protein
MDVFLCLSPESYGFPAGRSSGLSNFGCLPIPMFMDSGNSKKAKIIIDLQLRGQLRIFCRKADHWIPFSPHQQKCRQGTNSINAILKYSNIKRKFSYKQFCIKILYFGLISGRFMLLIVLLNKKRSKLKPAPLIYIKVLNLIFLLLRFVCFQKFCLYITRNSTIFSKFHGESSTTTG